MKDDGGDVRVETPRLILRRYRESDFEDLAAMAADPGMFRYSERGPMTGDEAWGRLLRHAGHWSLLGYGVFAVEEKETGRFVGEAGLSQFRRALGEPFDSRLEVTWSITAGRQGRGFAREAAEAALRWMDGIQAEATVCMIHIANVPSLRLAEKLGYRPFTEIEYKGYPALLFERAASLGDRL
jgi:RimJ/RimL family protein N-acetyltransferase